MIDNYARAVELINKKKIDFTKNNKKTECFISEAEVFLSVLFPKSYKVFLKDFGYATFLGLRIYGIIDNNFINSSIPDAIWLNTSNRKDFNQPTHIITISDIGDGSYYALDLSQMNDDNECPVVIWPIGGYEMTPVLEIVAPDFGTWFLDEIKEQVKWKEEDCQAS